MEQYVCVCACVIEVAKNSFLFTTAAHCSWESASTYLSYRWLTIKSQSEKGEEGDDKVPQHGRQKGRESQQRRLLWERCSHAHWVGKPRKHTHH